MYLCVIGVRGPSEVVEVFVYTDKLCFLFLFFFSLTFILLYKEVEIQSGEEEFSPLRFHREMD